MSEIVVHMGNICIYIYTFFFFTVYMHTQNYSHIYWGVQVVRMISYDYSFFIFLTGQVW